MAIIHTYSYWLSIDWMAFLLDSYLSGMSQDAGYCWQIAETSAVSSAGHLPDIFHWVFFFQLTEMDAGCRIMRDQSGAMGRMGLHKLFSIAFKNMRMKAHLMCFRSVRSRVQIERAGVCPKMGHAWSNSRPSRSRSFAYQRPARIQFASACQIM